MVLPLYGGVLLRLLNWVVVCGGEGRVEQSAEPSFILWSNTAKALV